MLCQCSQGWTQSPPFRLGAGGVLSVWRSFTNSRGDYSNGSLVFTTTSAMFDMINGYVRWLIQGSISDTVPNITGSQKAIKFALNLSLHYVHFQLFITNILKIYFKYFLYIMDKKLPRSCSIYVLHHLIHMVERFVSCWSVRVPSPFAKRNYPVWQVTPAFRFTPALVGD